ncbi:MAG: Hpt domain-containing protein [Sulfurimonas sp.]|nr:Hpt domain-containing protein [Sulfurimonas sp.]
MLLFNAQKKFIGIDAKDLQTLGYANLSAFVSEIDDFADMFVKKPGFIHNFKHVNWIDFVECADSLENAKVIITTNSKNFQCFLSVETMYLTDEPSSKSFLVHLHQIKELTDTQTEYISVPLLEQTTPPSVLPTSTFEAEEEFVPAPITEETSVFDTPLEETKAEDDFKIDLDVEVANDLAVSNSDYVFDPLIASKELGLPVDLIEEFVEDFIAQAKEFKDELYLSHEDEDKSKLKILSHKLKGVAANLRIEDALESLTLINVSDNNNEIKIELDCFYKIISKLSGELVQNTPQKVAPELAEDFKLEIKDEEVPERINIAELDDDDFSPDIDEYEDLEFETLEIDDDLNDEIFSSPPITYIKENVANEIGLDQKDFDALFTEYLREAKSITSAVATAILNKDAQTWKRLAITLKGMSDNMRIVDSIKDLGILIDSQEVDIATEANTHIIQCITELSKTKE